jgi:RNA polymerase sigma-70 factor (ECF subfamily)
MAGSNTFECVLRAWEANERELLAFLILRAKDSHAAEDLLQEVGSSGKTYGEMR